MIPFTELVPTRWGNIATLKCDIYQYQALVLYGEWAHDEVEICRSLIKPGDVVLDIGANVGSTALPFALRAGPSGKVFAFEPQYLPYLCLCATAVLNGVAEWLKPVQAAVGSSEGTIEVPNVDPRKPNNTGGVRLADDRFSDHLQVTGPKSPVKLLTVDGMNLSRLNFMKIDVEGMEADVLNGARFAIEKFRPIIWAEALPHIPENRRAMKEFFDSHHYRSWEFMTPVFSEKNCRGRTENAFVSQADMNVLAMHESQEPPACVEQVDEFKP